MGDPSNPGKDIPLTGYADPLSGRPGDTIEFKVSSQGDRPWQASLVRIRCADPNPEGPGIVEETCDVDLGGPFPPRSQRFDPGSYGEVASLDVSGECDRVTLKLTIAPFLLEPGKRQTMMALISDNGTSALGLEVSGEDSVTMTLKGEAIATVKVPLRRRHWYRVEGAWTTGGGGGLTVTALAEDGTWSADADVDPEIIAGSYRCLVAADWDGAAVRHFNGKIEAPSIFYGAGESETPLATWDFSREISTTRFVDTGPGGHHGRLVNFPVRAMTGSAWDGSEMNWRHRPDHYGAIHFHEDDIVDFGWQTDLSLVIPEDLPSGAYAVRIDDGEYRDWMPFYVLPAVDRRGNGLCVLISTFTYAIYGNHARPDFTPEWPEMSIRRGGYPWNPAVFPRYGLSTYNVHSDGSGICHAGHRRPLLNMRPGYITYPDLEGSAIRHYQADSHLLYWLDRQGIEYDLVTDRELHEEGVAALSGYSTLCTGSHPEYHTPQTLDALTAWRRQGGNFIYLGGNGFYWRVAAHPEDHSVLEIRRAEGGIRAWAAEPGEYYHAFDGGYGGLWRRNRRPPQQLAGVGFSAQGTFFGSYYRRSPESHENPEVAFLFEGIDDDILGDFGLCGGGAAGFEIDRFDPDLGSDPDIIVVASSEGHGDEFTLVPEERLTHITNWPGVPERELIRADMVYQRQGNGGKLFATGSITFCGSLLWNRGDNNISRLLRNVLDNFLV